MKDFIVCYVDGHDMKYKTFEVEAENVEQAVEAMTNYYKDIGDFEHLVVDVIENGREEMRIQVDAAHCGPSRAHPTDAGLDLKCKKGGILWPWHHKIFDTGLHIELPEGTWGKIESKSGLNCNHNIVSCGGTIDEGYTGSIKVKLYNLGWRPYRIRTGDKVAQLIIQECINPELVLVHRLEKTERGDNGFGSSGR